MPCPDGHHPQSLFGYTTSTGLHLGSRARTASRAGRRFWGPTLVQAAIPRLAAVHASVARGRTESGQAPEEVWKRISCQYVNPSLRLSTSVAGIDTLDLRCSCGGRVTANPPSACEHAQGQGVRHVQGASGCPEACAGSLQYRHKRSGRERFGEAGWLLRRDQRKRVGGSTCRAGSSDDERRGREHARVYRRRGCSVKRRLSGFWGAVSCCPSEIPLYRPRLLSRLCLSLLRLLQSASIAIAPLRSRYSFISLIPCVPISKTALQTFPLRK